MAAFDYSRAPAASTGFFTRLGAQFSTIFGQFEAWRDAQATRRALGELSDRELDDIGLVRGDIDDVANAPQPRF